MIHNHPLPFYRLLGQRRLASGPLAEVALAVMNASRKPAAPPIIIFNDATGRPIDLDLRGTEREILARLPQPPLATGRNDRRDSGGAARTRPAQTRRGRARGDAAAAALGMARRAARRRVGGACESWSTRRAAPVATAIARAPRAMRPIISCRPWPAICQISRKPRARCSRTTGGGSSALIADWPDDIRDHIVKLAFSDRAEPP